jgi:hypothetical protein
MYYTITARVTRMLPCGWQSSTGLPTFFLSSDVQGIINVDHARQIARTMIEALAPDCDIHGGVADEHGNYTAL